MITGDNHTLPLGLASYLEYAKLHNNPDMKKSNLYTRTGDTGKTSLVGGQRVDKTCDRLEAYGTIDELNACIGLLTSSPALPTDQHPVLLSIQHRLFDIGAYLATDNGPDSMTECNGLGHESIVNLERQIDMMDEAVTPLCRFVLPGGAPLAAQAHVARTVCRRAERRILKLAASAYVDPNLVRYINRLSDYLFVLSRYINHLSGTPEVFWDPDKQL